MRIIGATLAITLILVGCAGTKVTDPLDEEYKTKTTDSGEKVGVKDDKIVIQKRIYLEEQLHMLKAETEDLQNAIYGKSKEYTGGLWEALNRCRTRLADPRVGGDGRPEPMETWEDITNQDRDYEYTVSKDKNVMAVSEEGLADRIVRLKKTKTLLNSKFDRFKDKLEVCENKYRTALVQHGLNPDDTKAKGEWVDGPKGYKIWKMKRGATTDPEELMERKKKGQR